MNATVHDFSVYREPSTALRDHTIEKHRLNHVAIRLDHLRLVERKGGADTLQLLYRCLRVFLEGLVKRLVRRIVPNCYAFCHDVLQKRWSSLRLRISTLSRRLTHVAYPFRLFLLHG